MAGLWGNLAVAQGERIRSFTIVTTVPKELCAEVHNRMPVVLRPEVWPAWLSEEPATVRQLKSLLVPYPSAEMILLAGEPTRRQRQEQGPELDRAGHRVIAR